VTIQHACGLRIQCTVTPNEYCKELYFYMLTHTHTHTHTHPFMALDFVWNKPGEPVPEETFTQSHLSWSSIIPYLLHASNTIHGILPVQSTCSVKSKWSIVSTDHYVLPHIFGVSALYCHCLPTNRIDALKELGQNY